MKDVFISYNSKEYAEADWLRSVFEKNGISCWMAPESIPGGSDYAKEIPIAIRECRIFVIVLSSKAQDSIWVKKEVDSALNAKKKILPFQIEDCTLLDEFNFYFTDVQRYAAYQNKERVLNRMIAEIKAILGVPAEDSTPPALPEQQNSEGAGAAMGMAVPDEADEETPAAAEEITEQPEKALNYKALILSFVLDWIAVIVLAVLFGEQLLSGIFTAEEGTLRRVLLPIAEFLGNWGFIITGGIGIIFLHFKFGDLCFKAKKKNWKILISCTLLLLGSLLCMLGYLVVLYAVILFIILIIGTIALSILGVFDYRRD